MFSFNAIERHGSCLSSLHTGEYYSVVLPAHVLHDSRAKEVPILGIGAVRTSVEVGRAACPFPAIQKEKAVDDRAMAALYSAMQDLCDRRMYPASPRVAHGLMWVQYTKKNWSVCTPR